MEPQLDTLRLDAEIAIEVSPQRMAKLGGSVSELLDTWPATAFAPTG